MAIYNTLQCLECLEAVSCYWYSDRGEDWKGSLGQTVEASDVEKRTLYPRVEVITLCSQMHRRVHQYYPKISTVQGVRSLIFGSKTMALLLSILNALGFYIFHLE